MRITLIVGSIWYPMSFVCMYILEIHHYTNEAIILGYLNILFGMSSVVICLILYKQPISKEKLTHFKIIEDLIKLYELKQEGILSEEAFKVQIEKFDLLH